MAKDQAVQMEVPGTPAPVDPRKAEYEAALNDAVFDVMRAEKALRAARATERHFRGLVAGLRRQD